MKCKPLSFTKCTFDGNQGLLFRLQTVFLKFEQLYFSILSDCISLTWATVFLLLERLHFFNLSDCISPFWATVFSQNVNDQGGRSGFHTGAESPNTGLRWRRPSSVRAHRRWLFHADADEIPWLLSKKIPILVRLFGWLSWKKLKEKNCENDKTDDFRTRGFHWRPLLAPLWTAPAELDNRSVSFCLLTKRQKDK